MKEPFSKPQPLRIEEILSILPHRYPFLLVDRVIELDVAEGVITAQKNVTINEHFFQGHFPSHPIMPGVLILEALAQAGGLLLHQMQKDPTEVALLMSVDQAKFRQRVVPGDTLLLRCKVLQQGSRAGKVGAQALVGEKVAAQAEIGFVMVSKELL